MSSSRDRQPLLNGTSSGNGAASQLNPLAASFTYKPPSNPPSSTSSASRSPSLPSHAEPAPAPLTELADQDDHDTHEWTSQLRRAHTLSPHTPSYIERDNDGNSSFSYDSNNSDSDIPSLSYFRQMHLYIQFPASFIICMGFTIGLGVWRKDVRWLAFGLGAAGWLSSEPVKTVIFEIFQRPTLDPVTGKEVKGTGLGIPTVLHAVLQEFIRLGAVIMAVGLLPEPIHVLVETMEPIPRTPTPPPRGPRPPLPPLDTLFFSALWLGAGWSIAEILWNSRAFWQGMQLYDEILFDEEWESSEDEEERISSPLPLPLQGGVIYGRGTYGSTSTTTSRLPTNANNSLSNSIAIPESTSSSDKHRMVKLISPPGEERVSRDPEEEAREEAEEERMESRIRENEREELEARLGVPLYELPVAVVLVWRLDSILLALVLTLLLSLPFRTTSPSLVAFPLWPTFIFASLLRSCLSLLWVQKIKYFGIPSVSYSTLVLLVALLFGVLAAWGVIS